MGAARGLAVLLLVGIQVGAGIGKLQQARADEWIPTADRSQRRIEHQAAPIEGGQVMVMGGFDIEALGTTASPPSDATVLSSVDIFDPYTGRWTAAAPMPEPAGFQWAAVLMPGDVLLSGSLNTSDFSAGTFSALYDPRANRWVRTAPLPTGLTNPHAFMRAVVLNDGRVLIAGGIDNSSAGISNVALIYTPGIGNPAAVSWDYTRNAKTGAVTTLNHGRTTAGFAIFLDGMVLLVGGSSRVVCQEP